jgi:hypothetical protein
MTEIHIHHESGAVVVWRGQPADLFAMRQRVEENFAKTPLPNGVTRRGLVRSMLEDGLPADPQGTLNAVEVLVAWSLANGEDPEGSPPGWLTRYVGETDLISGSRSRGPRSAW